MADEQILKNGYELALIGNWIEGLHREDIKYFEPALFSYDLEAVKNGYSLLKMKIDKLISPDEYSEILNYIGVETFYLTAKAEALKEQLKYYQKEALKEAAHDRDPELLLRKIRFTKLLIDGQDIIPEAKGFSELFFKELEERNSESAALYGLEDLDQATHGIRRKNLITLGARPSDGKSALALQIADNVVSAGHKVLFFPLEMTAVENLERLMLRNDIIKPEEVRSGNYEIETRERIKDYLSKLENSNNFKIYEGCNKLDNIVNRIKSEQPYLVVIDQLTQVKTTGKFKDIRERYNEITATLKHIAIEENVAILLLSQLKRDTDPKNPSIDDLHESDHTGQDSDVVLLLTVAEGQDENAPRKQVTLTIAKQRQGIRGKRISLMFEGARYRFVNSVFNGFKPSMDDDTEWI